MNYCEAMAYVAGLLEGEGCFDFVAPGHPRIRMETTDEDVAYWLQHLVEGGTITNRQGKRSNHSDSFVWQTSRADVVKKVLTAIYPWTSARRRVKIDELMSAL
jgi:hypothetical protein